MSRPAMRQLSARLRCLRPLDNAVPVTSRYARYSSRYSNPGARPATALPVQSPSFIVDHDTADDVYTAPPDRPSNPHDAARVRGEYIEMRSFHLQKMRFAGIGLLLSVTGLAAVLYNLDLDDLEAAGKKNLTKLDAPSGSDEKFQGRDVHIIGAGEDKRIVADGEQETELVETGTSSVPFFPRFMYLPTSADSVKGVAGAPPNSPANPGNIQNEEEYRLVGLGIRTVSIFSIQVYVLGLYVRANDISTLQSRLIHLINESASTLVPSEKEDLKKRLLDPTTSSEIWDKVLRETDVKSAWRIVPTRNTDFAHLRDGWITGIKRGTQEAAIVAKAKAAGPVETEYESESFGDAVRDFKNLFQGGGRAPKGSVVVLLRDAVGALDILFSDPAKTQGFENFGSVQDARIGRLIWMGYLAGKNVSSEAARKAVVDGFVGFAARPVGSVETMVR